MVPFRQVTLRLRRRVALFDELRGVLRIVAALPENETAEDLDEMRTETLTLVFPGNVAN